MRVSAVLAAIAVTLAAIAPALAGTPDEPRAEPPLRLVVGFHDAVPEGLDGLLDEVDASLLHRDDTLSFIVVDALRPSTLGRLAAEPAVRYVALDGVAHGLGYVPDDPEYHHQAPLFAVRAPVAWSDTRGTDVLVAVLDTGIDPYHPDLVSALWRTPAEPEWGHDFANNDTNPTDDEGHGTLVAGIIAARMDNGIGIAGVAPEARILPVKVLDRHRQGAWSGICSGIRYAADKGAAVISMSLGGTNPPPCLRDALQYALTRGSIPIAAAGNNGTAHAPLYPAAYPEALAVGATDDAGNPASFSNSGPEIDLAAPGVSVLSTARGGDYAAASGTSMAAPHVAGAAALLKVHSPTLGAEGLRAALLANARDLATPGRDDLTGAGMVNATVRAIPDPIPYLRLEGRVILPAIVGASTEGAFLVEPDRRHVAVTLKWTELLPGSVLRVEILDPASGRIEHSLSFSGSPGTLRIPLSPGLHAATLSAEEGLAGAYTLTLEGRSA